jgi:hypothetical protein
MRYLAAGLVFLLVLIGLELHWTPWRFLPGAFGPQRTVIDGPGGTYGLLSYDYARFFQSPPPRFPRVERVLIVAGPLGTIHAAHVVAVGAAALAGLFVLAMSRGAHQTHCVHGTA